MIELDYFKKDFYWEFIRADLLEREDNNFRELLDAIYHQGYADGRDDEYG